MKYKLTIEFEGGDHTPILLWNVALEPGSETNHSIQVIDRTLRVRFESQHGRVNEVIDDVLSFNLERIEC